jgi:universal stress protein family protein
LVTNASLPDAIGPISSGVAVKKEYVLSKLSTHPRIVVCVDRLPASVVAIRWAARDAELRNAPLTLVHVVPATAGKWLESSLAGRPGRHTKWKPTLSACSGAFRQRRGRRRRYDRRHHRGFSRGWQLDKAVRLDIAAGAASLLTPGKAPRIREYVERFFEMVADPIDIDAPRRNDGKPRPAYQWLSAQARTSP